MKPLTKKLVNKLFKQAIKTWFDENLTLMDHVISVFAKAGFPVQIKVNHDDANDEDEIYDSLQRNLAATA
jgi:hypothetical protein